jgi:voltage-dependent calcium channel L type alpha-1D
MGIIFADNCYFKDGWNVLDFMVVTTAIISTIPGYTNFASLRMFRLIRPLRTLSIYPSMKLLTNALFSSIS